MNSAVLLAYVVFVVIVATQFGRRLSPSRSLGWWALFLFLGIAIVAPGAYQALATTLGFRLVSNFLFAVLFGIVLFQLADQASLSTRMTRAHRRFVAEHAAKDYVANFVERGGPRQALIVVPNYNEEESVPFVAPRLRKLAEASQGAIAICAVDDGSRDATWRALQQELPRQCTRHLANIGVGGVLLTAFAAQRDLGFEYVVQCDGDGQHPIEDIARLVEHASREKLDLLVGSRFAPNAGVDQSSTKMRRAGGLLIRAGLMFFGRGAVVNDPTSGFRVFSARLGQLLLQEMPDEYPEPETLALAALKGLKIAEIGVTMEPRRLGESSINRLGAAKYMQKVITALLGLRLRSLVQRLS